LFRSVLKHNKYVLQERATMYVTSQRIGTRNFESWTDIRLTRTTDFFYGLLFYTKENTFRRWGIRNNTSQSTRRRPRGM